MNGPSSSRPDPNSGRPAPGVQDAGEKTATPHLPAILIVDDDPQVLDLLGSALTHVGFEVRSASSQSEAVECFRAHQRHIALALIDLFLPDGDGLSVMSALRSMEPTLCCCVMTGGGGDYSIDQLFAHGAAIVFHKPFDLHHLLRAVQHLVYGPRLRVEPQPISSPAETDRRQFPRWRGPPRDVLVALPHPGPAAESRGTVIDRSLHGVGIVTPIAPPVGAAIHVRSAATAYEKWLRYEVRHIRPSGEFHFLGCRLSEPPTLSVLSLYE